MLQGQQGMIMNGMEFSASNQIDINSIDLYEPLPDAATAEIAFVESDYGAVAVQFDGADFFGQKTFCISYSLANLDDGIFPNTREELLYRILYFFDPTIDVKTYTYQPDGNIKIYPNPANDRFVLEFKLDQKSWIKVDIFDITGKLVLNKPLMVYDMGVCKITVETNNLHSGAYFYRISSERQHNTGKLLISR